MARVHYVCTYYYVCAKLLLLKVGYYRNGSKFLMYETDL